MVPLRSPYHPPLQSLPASGDSPHPSGEIPTAYCFPASLAKKPTSCTSTRRNLMLAQTTVTLSTLFPTTLLSAILFPADSSASTTTSDALAKFSELPDSGGVKALDLRVGTGSTPIDGDQVAIHYYGRLAAKQGWRFDSTYDHKDSIGEPIPFNFILGSGKVISGIDVAVRSMRVGGVRRVIIPPSQGYQNTLQEPVPPNFFDRQRLFTTIFNPTRLANGEGSTLGTLIFDIELVSVKQN